MCALFLLHEDSLAERSRSMAALVVVSVVGFDLSVGLSAKTGWTSRCSKPRPCSGCTSESISIRSSVNGGVRNSRWSSLSDPIVEIASKSKGSACNSLISASLKEMPRAW